MAISHSASRAKALAIASHAHARWDMIIVSYMEYWLVIRHCMVCTIGDYGPPIETDLRAPSEVATRTAVGVARPSAQGQAMTNTSTASFRPSRAGDAADATSMAFGNHAAPGSSPECQALDMKRIVKGMFGDHGAPRRLTFYSCSTLMDPWNKRQP